MSDNAKMVFADNLKSLFERKGPHPTGSGQLYGVFQFHRVRLVQRAQVSPALIKCSVWQIGWVFGCPTLPVSTINSMMPI